MSLKRRVLQARRSSEAAMGRGSSQCLVLCVKEPKKMSALCEQALSGPILIIHPLKGEEKMTYTYYLSSILCGTVPLHRVGFPYVVYSNSGSVMDRFNFCLPFHVMKLYIGSNFDLLFF
jgi:hypothetical protein